MLNFFDYWSGKEGHFEYKMQGTTSPGYESVAELFETYLREGKEEYAQVCVYVDNERVVDLWGVARIRGSQSIHSQQDIEGESINFDGDTLTCVFSSSKSIAAILIAMAVDRGYIQYTDLVSAHWPEFGQQGKEGITVADVLRHEAGLVKLSALLEPEDLLAGNMKQANNRLGKVIENSKPVWPEWGGRRQYHALTRGWILNEVFRRAHPDGLTLGEFLGQEVAKPLGARVFIGCWDRDYVPVRSVNPLAITMDLAKGILSISYDKATGTPSGNATTSMYSSVYKAVKTVYGTIANITQISLTLFRSFTKMNMPIKGLSLPNGVNSDIIRRGESPSFNANCSARGLALLASAMANRGQAPGGVHILSEAGWAALHDHPVKDYLASPQMLPFQLAFTQGGLAKFEDDKRGGYYGWMGLGGSIFQWHPVHKVGFGFTCTRLDVMDANRRGGDLQAEVIKCVEKIKSKN